MYVYASFVRSFRSSVSFIPIILFKLLLRDVVRISFPSWVLIANIIFPYFLIFRHGRCDKFSYLVELRIYNFQTWFLLLFIKRFLSEHFKSVRPVSLLCTRYVRISLHEVSVLYNARRTCGDVFRVRYLVSILLRPCSVNSVIIEITFCQVLLHWFLLCA